MPSLLCPQRCGWLLHGLDGGFLVNDRRAAMGSQKVAINGERRGRGRAALVWAQSGTAFLEGHGVGVRTGPVDQK